MNIEHIIHAWRDDEYRASLGEAARKTLPASPIGEVDLSDLELEQVAGAEQRAVSIIIPLTMLFCPSWNCVTIASCAAQ